MSEFENKSIIDMDAIISPAVLSGILGISVPMVFQGKQDGKLPPESNSTYRRNIQQYIQWHKQRNNLKAGTIAEKKMVQDTRNGAAKEEQQWMKIRAERGELIDKAEFSEVFLPIFQLVKSSLVVLARENPALQEKIDTILKTWTGLGEEISEKAKEDGENFVKTKLLHEDEEGEGEGANLESLMQEAIDEQAKHEQNLSPADILQRQLLGFPPGEDLV